MGMTNQELITKQFLEEWKKKAIELLTEAKRVKTADFVLVKQDNWEQLINQNNGEVVAEAHILTAQDVIEGLGYTIAIKEIE